MANLLIVVPEAGASFKARETFASGVRLIELLKHQKPSRVLETDAAFVASYARRNGSSTPLLRDAATGNWLVAVGTWFHDAGFASGQEDRLLARLAQVGPKQLAKEVEGFFVIVTGEAATRDVTVITDVSGTLHCYTRKLEGALAISVSSLTLAALGDVTLDAVGCQEFLQTQAMYEDRTFFKEVRKLDASRCYRFRDGALLSRERYWHATDLQPDSLDGDASVEALREAVLAGARKISAAFPNPVVDLTGGYDSRAGVAAFLAAGVPFKSAVGGKPDHPDVVIAEELARRVGLDLRHFEPPVVRSFEQLQRAMQYTDGEYDLVDYARIHDVQSDLEARFDISINSYSGEIGRGYGWEVLMPHTGERRPMDAFYVARRRFVNPNFDASIVAPALRMDAPRHFGEVVARADEGLGDLPTTLQYDYSMTMLRCQRWYGRIASSTNQIWPCMSFFLLRSIMKPMLETNTRSRANSLLFRRLLAELSPPFTQVPLARGYPPLVVNWKTLHRFWPLVPLYGGKVVDRLRRYAGIRPAPAPAGTTPRELLWQDDAVRQTLDPRTMLSAELMDADGLARFVERSRATQFDLAGQWSLLLTLECTLQRLRSLRSELRDGTTALPQPVAPAGVAPAGVVSVQ